MNFDQAGIAAVQSSIGRVCVDDCLRAVGEPKNGRLAGETTVRITPATNATGVTTITVQVRDPATDCVSVTTFVLSVGAAAVPTLAEWAVIGLALLLMFAGYRALQQRQSPA